MKWTRRTLQNGCVPATSPAGLCGGGRRRSPNRVGRWSSVAYTSALGVGGPHTEVFFLRACGWVSSDWTLGAGSGPVARQGGFKKKNLWPRGRAAPRGGRGCRSTRRAAEGAAVWAFCCGVFWLDFGQMWRRMVGRTPRGDKVGQPTSQPHCCAGCQL